MGEEKVVDLTTRINNNIKTFVACNYLGNEKVVDSATTLSFPPIVQALYTSHLISMEQWLFLKIPFEYFIRLKMSFERL